MVAMSKSCSFLCSLKPALHFVGLRLHFVKSWNQFRFLALTEQAHRLCENKSVQHGSQEISPSTTQMRARSQSNQPYPYIKLNHNIPHGKDHHFTRSNAANIRVEGALYPRPLFRPNTLYVREFTRQEQGKYPFMLPEMPCNWMKVLGNVLLDDT